MVYWVDSVNTILGVVGFILTLGTFIIAIRFQKHIENLTDKKEFQKKKKVILTELKGFKATVEDEMLYSTTTLASLLYKLEEIASRYSSFSRKTERQIRLITVFIQNECMTQNGPDMTKQVNLCSKLVTLIALLEKEAIL